MASTNPAYISGLGVSAAIILFNSVAAYLIPKPAGLEDDLLIAGVVAGWIGYVSGVLLRGLKLASTKRLDTSRRILLLFFCGTVFLVASYWYFSLYHTGGIYPGYVLKIYASFTLVNNLFFFIAGLIGFRLSGGTKLPKI